MKRSLWIVVAFTAACGPRPVEGPAPVAEPLPWRFTPEASDAAAVIRLELESIEGDQVKLKVVGRGMPQLSGVAFRLTGAEGAQAEAEPGWAVSRFSARPSGELWGGLAQLGTASIAAETPTVLARLTVTARGEGPLRLTFRDGKNRALGPRTTLAPAWAGGTLERASRPSPPP